MPRTGRIDFKLYLISDRHGLPPGRSLIETVAAALAGGVRAVQLREKDLCPRELLPLALELRALTRRFGARLLINDRIDVAQAVAADGVHLAGSSLPTAMARHLLGPSALIGVSTHKLEEVLAAARDGADFVTFGPVYPTASKAAYGAPVGLEALRRACAATSLPIFALGGVKSNHIPQLQGAGAAGIAMISAIFSATDPQAAAEHLSRQFPPLPATA
jgi:thiamine-phosphate pyrophosphorylase